MYICENFNYMLEDFRLKVFVAVAACRSFTKAAAELDISQPAVSQHISELEKSYGIKFFERQRGETVPTVAGEMFLERAKSILAGYDAVEQLFRRFPDKEVKVSASDEVFTYVSERLLGDFLKIHPEVNLHHTFMDEPDLKISIAPSLKEKRMMELSYHPSSSFASTRLWAVLSEILQPTRK